MPRKPSGELETCLYLVLVKIPWEKLLSLVVVERIDIFLDLIKIPGELRFGVRKRYQGTHIGKDGISKITREILFGISKDPTMIFSS